MSEETVNSCRICGVIPARWASTRLPGKSLVPLCGKPLICWVIERARQATCLDRLIVATDDARIQEVANRAGAEAVMTSPDHPSGTDRLAAAITGVEAEVVINIQGDEPLIEPALIDALAEAMQRVPARDMATVATPLRSERDIGNPGVVKVVCDGDGNALYFSRAAIPFVRDAEARSLDGLYWHHHGLYAYRRRFLDRFVREPPSLLERAESLEQLRALHMGAAIWVLRAENAGMGVDTPEDVAYVESLIRERGLDRSS